MIERIADPLESVLGDARPANDPVFDGRSRLLDSPLWASLSAKHDLTAADLDWLVAHVRSRRAALASAGGERARRRVQAEYLGRLADRFAFDPRDRAAAWRALHEPDLFDAAEIRESGRAGDLLFLDALLDSLIPPPADA